METTLVLIKPDCILRGLAGEVLDRFVKRGLGVVGIKLMALSEEILREHYSHIAEKPFFPGVVASMQKTPVIAIALRGIDAAKVARSMAGSTNARDAAPGTIRGDYAASIQNNIVHISEDSAAAAVEVPRFFSADELYDMPAELAGNVYAPDELK
jgi:nucleoside-diphosphate kinase